MPQSGIEFVFGALGQLFGIRVVIQGRQKRWNRTRRAVRLWFPGDPATIVSARRGSGVFRKTGRSRSLTSETPSTSCGDVADARGFPASHSSDRRHRVCGTLNQGFSNKHPQRRRGGDASMISPRPVQRAAHGVRKNGMSEPSDAAISCRRAGPSLPSWSWSSPSRVVAASLLPPPSPAPWGMDFCRVMAKLQEMPAAVS